MNVRKKKTIAEFKVRRTKLRPIPKTEAEMSPLGRTLMKIVAEIDASDEPPMTEADFEQELEMRRTGYIMNGR